MRKRILSILLMTISLSCHALDFTKQEFISFFSPPNEIKIFFDKYKDTIIKIKEQIETLNREDAGNIRDEKIRLFKKKYTIYPCFNFLLKRGLVYMAEQVQAIKLLNAGLFSRLRIANTYLYPLTQDTAFKQENYAVVIEKLNRYKDKIVLGVEYAEQLSDYFLLMGIKPKEIAFDKENNKIIICRLFYTASSDSDKTQTAIIDELFRPHRIFKRYAKDISWSDEAKAYLNNLKQAPPSREALLQKYNVTEEDLVFPDITAINVFLD